MNCELQISSSEFYGKEGDDPITIGFKNHSFAKPFSNV